MLGVLPVTILPKSNMEMSSAFIYQIPWYLIWSILTTSSYQSVDRSHSRPELCSGLLPNVAVQHTHAAYLLKFCSTSTLHDHVLALLHQNRPSPLGPCPTTFPPSLRSPVSPAAPAASSGTSGSWRWAYPHGSFPRNRAVTLATSSAPRSDLRSLNPSACRMSCHDISPSNTDSRRST